MKITSVERQKNNKRRVSVYVDGQYYGSLIDEVYAASGFTEGCEFDEGKFFQLKSKDESRAAFDYALHFLEKRARSKHEIIEKLKSADFGDEAITTAIEKLKGYKYIDDSQFAKMVLNDEKNVKYGSKRSAMMRLKKYGINEDTALEAIEDYSKDDEYQNALIWAQKLNKRHSAVDDIQKKKQKIASAMARRGFSWDNISKAISEATGNGGIEE